MAYLNYKFERAKNLYEKTWDYDERLTKIVSFITDWFWITDVTELSSNERTCYKGFNNYLMLLSLIYIAVSISQTFYFIEYSSYIDWLRYLVVFLMIIAPLAKLMFKMTCYFLVYYIFVLNYLTFDFGNYFANYAFVFILFNLIGVYYNHSYLQKVLTYNGFKLKSIELNKFSCYYVYDRFIKNLTESEIKQQEIQKLEGK
ncbi:MAG TPA: hypothetical protein DCL21_06910 [Alphaproteobacteria bacterium]|nr:hypothetical protein [Alphaproteobacteria bacterium]